MSYLDKIVALAQGSAPAPEDVTEPCESDTTAHLELLQVPDDHGPYIQSPRATQEQDSLTPLNKAKISSYLDGARQAQAAGDDSLCTSLLIRAFNACKVAGKHHMADDIRQHIRSIGMERNNVNTDVSSGAPNQSDNPSSDHSGSVAMTALGKILALGAVRPFERTSSKGKIEHVSGYDRDSVEALEDHMRQVSMAFERGDTEGALKFLAEAKEHVKAGNKGGNSVVHGKKHSKGKHVQDDLIDVLAKGARNNMFNGR